MRSPVKRADQAEMRLRFLKRRRLNVARPPAVAMRARKPIFIFRRRLLGLYEGFIDGGAYLFSRRLLICRYAY